MRQRSLNPGPMGCSTVLAEPAEPAETREPGVLSVEEFLDLAQDLAREFDRGDDGTPPAILCAVLGRPVAHSLSPVIHHSAARGIPGFRYVRVEAGEEEEIRTLLARSPSCVAGFSVTMPGKPHALTVADEVSDRAAAIGSANTLVRVCRSDGRWRADNTDVIGLGTCLDAVLGNSGPVTGGDRAVVVGNGGTARPAVAALAEAGFRHLDVVARSKRAYDLRALAGTYGMDLRWTRLDAPDLGAVCAASRVLVSTVPEQVAAQRTAELSGAPAVIDVIYDPYPTTLLTAARAKGHQVADGLLMLAGQGAEQFRQFTGTSASPGAMYTALQEHLGLD